MKRNNTYQSPSELPTAQAVPGASITQRQIDGIRKEAARLIARGEELARLADEMETLGRRALGDLWKTKPTGQGELDLVRLQ